ncbi:MAG: hypothetical protein HYY44_03795 [Deltaproteobacteria bacterium]|nr:hypothetical protein [Deltaproteobacteria bacterium]
MTAWLVVLIYLVPILGTIAQIARRFGQIWNIGKSIRAFLPDDRLFRKFKGWEGRFLSWKFDHPLAKQTNLLTINLWAGKIEYAVGHLRDYTIGLFMMGAFVYDLTVMVFYDPSFRAGRFPSLFYHGLFALLTLWTYRRHVGIGLKISEFLRVNPQVHPQELFDHYYRRLGPLAVPIPSRASKTVLPAEISYRTGKKPRRRFWPILHGAYDTAIIARLHGASIGPWRPWDRFMAGRSLMSWRRSGDPGSSSFSSVSSVWKGSKSSIPWKGRSSSSLITNPNWILFSTSLP